MKNIYPGEILNITSFNKGFVFAAKELSDTGKPVARFFGYDATADKFTRIKKNTFLKIKFGYDFDIISRKLEDYISCDSGFLNDGKIMAIYPNGHYSIFNNIGIETISSVLTYRSYPACDIACDGDNIWCAVPEDNSVIKYNPREGKTLLRVGGGEETKFDAPISVTLNDNKLYICNRGSRKIRILNTDDNTVRDFRVFNEKINKYILVCGKEFVWLQSGLWSL